jgi:uncharacterized protein involved in tolerance to divalent cations
VNLSSPVNNPVELVLTCASWQEADKIARELLEQKLVACVEFLEVKSKYLWHGSLDEAKEVKLVMQSMDGLFNQIETAVAKLHSYETFVLQQTEVARLSTQAIEWLDQEINKITDKIEP